LILHFCTTGRWDALVTSCRTSCFATVIEVLLLAPLPPSLPSLLPCSIPFIMRTTPAPSALHKRLQELSGESELEARLLREQPHEHSIDAQLIFQLAEFGAEVITYESSCLEQSFSSSSSSTASSFSLRAAMSSPRIARSQMSFRVSLEPSYSRRNFSAPPPS
jgi:hypothetical protein